MAELQQPIRIPTPDTQPFWDGIKRGELILPRCKSCGLLHHSPRSSCVDCSSQDLAWVKCSGRGKVHSYVILHGQPGTGADFRSSTVEINAVVEIDEGPHIFAILVDITPDSVHLDMPVEIVYEGVGDGPTLLTFKPV